MMDKNENMPEINKLLKELAESPWGKPPPRKYSLDSERRSKTIKFEIYAKVEDGKDFSEGKQIKGYFTLGFYADGYPGELFIWIGKEGEETHGWVNTVAKTISMLLQYGVAPEKIYGKLIDDEFEPKGITTVKQAPICKSIVNMILKYMKATCPPTAEPDGRTSYDAMIDSVVDEKDDG